MENNTLTQKERKGEIIKSVDSAIFFVCCLRELFARENQE